MRLVCFPLFLILACSSLAAQDDAPKRNEWEAALDVACEGADEIEVAAAWDKKAYPDWSTKGADKASALLKLVKVDIPKSGRHWLTDGEVYITLKKAGKEVCTLAYIFGFALRWHDGKWDGDAVFADGVGDAIAKWFDEQGYTALKKAADERRDEEERERRKQERFRSHLPKKAVEALDAPWPQDIDDWAEAAIAVGARMRKAVGDDETLMLGVCRALGSVEDSWSVSDGTTDATMAAAKACDEEVFVKVAGKLSVDDTIGRLGAARLYFFESLGRDADAEIRTPIEINLGDVTLSHGNDENKDLVLRRLGGNSDKRILAYLIEVFEGKKGVEITRPRAYGEEPGIRACAALALARNDVDVRDTLKEKLKTEKDKSDHAAYEICLALLGDATMIKGEHFELESYTIGYAGLQAIRKYNGAHGMDVLVNNAFEHPWAGVNEEAGEVFQDIVGKRWNRSEHIRNSRYFDEMRKWWKDNGAELEKRRREDLEAKDPHKK
ncbi:MAG: hypothetical protein ICCCNLDF_02143 [Planctomycetes bacterium]|nr:hypothetical protein [Planctomycetota bacterium]